MLVTPVLTQFSEILRLSNGVSDVFHLGLALCAFRGETVKEDARAIVEPLDDGHGEKHNDKADDGLEGEEEEAPNESYVFVHAKTSDERDMIHDCSVL